MKKIVTILAAIAFLNANAQDEEKPQKDNRPVKDQFESGVLIDNQTSVVKSAGTLEFIMQHRFGKFISGDDNFDLYGVYAPANIRIGINYTPIKNLQVGVGTTKNRILQDFNLKYSIIRQSRSGSIPVSVTAYTEVAKDLRNGFFNDANGKEMSNARYSYFSQLMITRSFGKHFTLQIAPSYSYFNVVDTFNMHGNFGISCIARYKFSPQSSIMIGYNRNLTKQANGTYVNLGFSIGYEVSTGSHAFQVFFTTYSNILDQHNMLYNTNRTDVLYTENGIRKTDFSLGFNITRLWNFKSK